MNAADRARGVVADWTLLLVRGLPERTARERFDEIASDLWEHQHDAESRSTSGARTAASILLRALRGVPADLQWHWTVRQGAGDVRFYAAVQLYALLALLAALLLPARYTRGSDLLIVAGLYVLAKICETADKQIFSLGHFVSGHTLKHLAAGAAGLWILRMLQKRQPIGDH